MQFWHYPENNIPSKRTLKDSKSNKYGERLLLLCKNMDLLIANGRCGVDKSVGHTEISGYFRKGKKGVKIYGINGKNVKHILFL